MIEPVERVDVDGVRMAFQATGAGRTLLAVHGNFASKRWFTEQLRALPRGWRVVAPDLPNFSDSDPLKEPISIETYARYLCSFVDALGETRVVLMGHSLGGAVAQVFAARYPERLLGLVLVASPPPQGFKTPEDRYPFFEMLRGNRALMAQVLAPTIEGSKPSYFGAIVEDALELAPAAFTGNARALERYAVEADLKGLRVPTLVLQGGRDTIVSEAMARATARSIPGARLELWPEAGHSPQIEQPERFNARLAEFLEVLP